MCANVSRCEVSNNLPINIKKVLKVSKNVDNLPFWWKTFWCFAAFMLISRSYISTYEQRKTPHTHIQ